MIEIDLSEIIYDPVQHMFQKLHDNNAINPANFKDIVLFALRRFKGKEKQVLKWANWAGRVIDQEAKADWVMEAEKVNISLFDALKKVLPTELDAALLTQDIYINVLGEKPEIVLIKDGLNYIMLDPSGKTLYVKQNGTPPRPIFFAVPEKIKIIRCALDLHDETETKRFEIIFKTTAGRLKIEGEFEDIIALLKGQAAIAWQTKAPDTLSIIINHFIEQGWAEIVDVIPWDGFYLMPQDGGLQLVLVQKRLFKLKDITKSQLRQALVLLNDLAEWFAPIKDKFATAIKWGLTAPLFFAYKQLGKWQPWLFLYGASRAGKTTLGEIILSIWASNDSLHKKGGSSIDTVARLGTVLESSTFPVLVNEPAGALQKRDVVDMFKSAAESIIARSRYRGHRFTTIYALAPLIITSNIALPGDDALLRRFILLQFTWGEKISEEKAKKFDEIMRPKLNILSAIGYTLAKTFLDECNTTWFRLNWDELARMLLEKLYALADLDIPSWIYLRAESKPEDLEELYIEAIRETILDKINAETRKVDISTLEDRIKYVIKERLIPWAYLREDNNSYIVILTTGFARAVGKNLNINISLRSLAELLGWQYKRGVKIAGRAMQAIIVPYQQFLSFILGNEEQEVDEEPKEETEEKRKEQVDIDSVLGQVLHIIHELQDGKELHISWIVNKAAERGISTNVVKQVLQKMINDGMLITEDNIWYRLR